MTATQLNCVKNAINGIIVSDSAIYAHIMSEVQEYIRTIEVCKQHNGDFKLEYSGLASGSTVSDEFKRTARSLRKKFMLPIETEELFYNRFVEQL